MLQEGSFVGFISPKKNAQDVSKYTNHENVLKFGGIDFPMKLQDIPKFEKLNPGISVNLYMMEKKKGKFEVFPCYLTSNKQARHVNLLFLEDRYYEENEFVQNEPSNYHYIWIKIFWVWQVHK